MEIFKRSTLCSALLICVSISNPIFASDKNLSSPSTYPSTSPNVSQQSIVRSNLDNIDTAPALVKEIVFQRDDFGSAHLIIEFDRPNAQSSLVVEENEVIVQLYNASIPENLRHFRDLSAINTPAISMDFIEDEKSSNIVLKLKPDHKQPLAYQVGNKYTVEVSFEDKSSLDNNDRKNITRVNTPLQARSLNQINDNDNGKGKEEYVYLPSSPRDYQIGYEKEKTTLRPTYTGSPVTFNFQDVPVRTILQLLAEEADTNIVASDTVVGNVTLRLDGVPWDQALDIVLRARGLDKRKDGDVIWIAPQHELAQYEQSKEDARIAIDNRRDLITEYVQINYHSAQKIMETMMQSREGVSGEGGGQGETGFLSPRGSLVADERTNILMISDIPRKVDRMKELIDIIDRPVDQVLIEARVVVAHESFVKELGSRFGLGGHISDHVSLGPNIGSNIDVGQRGGVSRGTMTNLGLLDPAGTIALSFLNAGRYLDIELSAMEAQGRGEVVSNPRIVTTNQREAVIEQGSEVGYVTMTGGNGDVPMPNVQFKDVLLQMIVTPTITNDGRVFLDMNVKKDNIEGFLDTSIGNVPQISKRQVNTAVLVEDGQTVVVGGIYEFNDSEDISKVPFLGDIPFLGNLFKNRAKNKEKAELLIFVTPTVLKVSPRPDLEVKNIPVVRDVKPSILIGDK